MTAAMNDSAGALDFHGQRVRSVMLDGEAWFSVPEVCAVLEIADAAQAARRLGETMKRVLRKSDQTVSNTVSSATFFPGRVARHTLINRAGLNLLVLRSDKPTAVAFQTWLAEVVIPSIQDHGGYIAEQAGLSKEDAAAVIAVARRAGLDRREEIEACFGREMKRTFRVSRFTPAQRRAMERRQAEERAQWARNARPRGPEDVF